MKEQNQITTMINGFIQQTAEDYDLPYEVVEQIHSKWHSIGLFYDKLEEYLTDKARFNCNPQNK